jgi:carbon monoxide dehydrogenase subunit G
MADCAATVVPYNPTSMATIRKEILIDTTPEKAWDALRDVGALHTRLVAGFVVDTKLEGSVRVVTFKNGNVAREEIVGIDESQRRVAWAIVGQSFHHYNSAAQVFDSGKGRARIVWITDLLPDSAAEAIDNAMTNGVAAMKKTLESAGT